MKGVHVIAATAASIVLASVLFQQAASQAIIGNGQVILGVNREADLNVPFVPTPLMPAVNPSPWNFVGLRDGSGRYTAAEAGCQCEGWGVSVSNLGISLDSNRNYGGAHNLNVVSFTGSNGGLTATSVVEHVDQNIRVTHKFKPSIIPQVYEVTVVIQNRSPQAFSSVVYRRTLDWDVSPTEFREHVSVYGANPSLVQSHDNGFCSADPFAACSAIDPATLNVNFIDNGPRDHGVTFDFKFGPIPPRESKTFIMYLGALRGEPLALAAATALNMETFSLGQQRIGPQFGFPYTFLLGFKHVGGNPVEIRDVDGDGIPDHLDNCPLTYNPLQLDRNGDGIGDRCCRRRVICTGAFASVSALPAPHDSEFTPIRILGVVAENDEDPDEKPAISISIVDVLQNQPVECPDEDLTYPDARVEGSAALLRNEHGGDDNRTRLYRVLFEASTEDDSTCAGFVDVLVNPGHEILPEATDDSISRAGKPNGGRFVSSIDG